MRSRVRQPLLAILGAFALILAVAAPARGGDPIPDAVPARSGDPAPAPARSGDPAPAPARSGDPVAAEQLDRQARTAFANGDTRAAAYAFEESARLFEHPSGYFNAARAWERASEPARAADAYQRALALGGLDDALVKQATERLAALEATLGTLSVTGPPGTRITVGHLKDADLPVKLHLSAGEQRVEVRLADGTQGAASIVRIVAGASATLEIPAHPPARPLVPPLVPPPTSRAPSVVGALFLGASVLSVGGAAVMGGFFLDQRSRITDPARTHDEQQAAHDAAAGLQVGANVAVVSAVIFGGAGLTFVLIGSQRTRAPAAITLRPGGLTFTGSF